jgi:hypothetical protein
MTSNSAKRPIASDVDVNPDAGVAATFPTYTAAAAPTPPTTNTHINFRRMSDLLSVHPVDFGSERHNRPADGATQTVKGGAPGQLPVLPWNVVDCRALERAVQSDR